MITFIITSAIICVFGIAVYMARKNRDKGESTSGLNEHPSTFKKPDNEMVNKSTNHTDKDETKTTEFK